MTTAYTLDLYRRAAAAALADPDYDQGSWEHCVYAYAARLCGEEPADSGPTDCQVPAGPAGKTVRRLLGCSSPGIALVLAGVQEDGSINLYDADLYGADLSEADLTDADLTRADLTNANLAWANLTYANLAGANLTNANLYDTNLDGANLTYANLSGANLNGANLAGANLTGCRMPNGSIHD